MPLFQPGMKTNSSADMFRRLIKSLLRPDSAYGEQLTAICEMRFNADPFCVSVANNAAASPN